MDTRLEAIRDLIIKREKEIDEIEWEDPQDPRIEGLLSELNDYKKREEDGEIYEPRF